MVLLSGKRFNSSPSLLEYGPTTWPACQTFHSQILPISSVPSLTNMSPHFSCLLSQPHGSSTSLSLQRSALMKFPFPPTWSPRLSLAINFSRKTPSIQHEFGSPPRSSHSLWAHLSWHSSQENTILIYLFVSLFPSDGKILEGKDGLLCLNPHKLPTMPKHSGCSIIFIEQNMFIS